MDRNPVVADAEVAKLLERGVQEQVHDLGVEARRDDSDSESASIQLSRHAQVPFNR